MFFFSVILVKLRFWLPLKLCLITKSNAKISSQNTIEFRFCFGTNSAAIKICFGRWTWRMWSTYNLQKCTKINQKSFNSSAFCRKSVGNAFKIFLNVSANGDIHEIWMQMKRKINSALVLWEKVFSVTINVFEYIEFRRKLRESWNSRNTSHKQSINRFLFICSNAWPHSVDQPPAFLHKINNWLLRKQCYRQTSSNLFSKCVYSRRYKICQSKNRTWHQ